MQYHQTISMATIKEETSETIFIQWKRRLDYLESWKELGIRPSPNECHADECDLLNHEVDDVKQLHERCLNVRQEMNQHLPPHDLARDDELVVQLSGIRNAGQGLFVTEDLSEPITCGQVLCYYTGHLHNYHSSRELKDKSYLLMVSGSIFVDPQPLPRIKARYINDPINESLVNCTFKAEPFFSRCSVVAVRDIYPGEELFVSYGELYWSQQPYQGTYHK